MATGKPSSSRLAFLDWMRGAAAVMMLNGHVFHSFTRTADREGPGYRLTQFVGGMPPALFLFLVGVTLAFLMASRERQGLPAAARVMAAMRRAGYLFLIAFLFRIQAWVFAWPWAQWRDLFKVDILNAMGFALALMSLLAIVPGVGRVWLAAALGALIAFGAPLVSLMDWSWLPGGVRAYVVPDLQSFGFFPWAAFVAFGVSAGSVLRTVSKERFDVVMKGAAGLALLLILGARYCSHLPYSLYPESEYWLNGPWLVLIKLGVVILILVGSYVWTQYGATDRWSWVRQFGVTSLLVYWVHTELVYGRWFWFWKERLSPLQTALVSVAVILSMLALSVFKTNWKSLRQRFAASPRATSRQRSAISDQPSAVSHQPSG